MAITYHASEKTTLILLISISRNFQLIRKQFSISLGFPFNDVWLKVSYSLTFFDASNSVLISILRSRDVLRDVDLYQLF